ncbi:FG-GAP-like repeat-containing protein [Thalassolituus sp.]|uniref:FG-GAP-like repeat-containing protein n=1 Tax=Thalassolituus sp. TaxID=2030822 RepID=UPI002A8010B3|nr:FG-GAP-like repeat-containing protein [Thalassolituus sp.]
MMFRRLFVSFLLVVSSALSYAGGYNSATHDLYTDGSRYLLQSKPLMVLIASDIVIPLSLDPLYDDILLTPNGSGGWATTYAPTAAEMSGNWVEATNTIYFYDYDSDGTQDLFIRAKNSGQQSILVYSHSGNNPSVIGISATQGGVDHSSASGYSISFNGKTITATKTGHLTMVSSISSTGISTFNAQNNNYELADEPSSGADSLEADTYVGSQSYTAAASQNGSVDVQFPITLPAGVSGLTPDIAVVYNSNVSNGLLGAGFNLAAGSSIRRCAKTVSTEGVFSTLSFNDSDALCFNGSKLIAVDGSSSLSNGAEYRTEIDSYSKIILSKTSNKFSFSVYGKNGVIHTYGKAVEANGIHAGVEKEWLITKSTDRFGNAIDYSYIDGLYGDVYLSSIKYSDITVSFNYNESTRNDSVVKFSGGDEYRIAKYLESVDIASTAVFKEYHYLYNLAGTGKYSTFNDILQLDAIQECGYKVAGNVSTRACKPALILDWNEQGFDLVDDSGSQVSTLDSRRQTLAVDWDQSGTDDIIVLGSDRISIHYSDASGQLQSAQTLYTFPSGKTISSIIPVDLNLDGAPELIFRSHQGTYGPADTNLQWHLFQHNGTVQSLGTLVDAGNSHKYPAVADVNGDGYPDVMLPFGSLQWKLALNTSATTGSASLDVPNTALLGTGDATKGLTNLGSVNGYSYFLNEKDAGLDLLKISKTGALTTITTGIVNEKYIPLDANGDGLKDILVGTSGNLLLYLNTGEGFKQVTTSVATSVILDSYGDGLTYRNYPTKVHDFNGDGLDDLSYVDGSQIKFLISTGSDFKYESFGGVAFSGVGSEAAETVIRASLNLPQKCYDEVPYLNLRNSDPGFNYDYSSVNLSGWSDDSVTGYSIADGADIYTNNIWQATVVLGSIQTLYDNTIHNPVSSLYLPYANFYEMDNSGNVIFSNDGQPVLKDGVNDSTIQSALGTDYFNKISDEEYRILSQNSFVYYSVYKSVSSAISSCRDLVQGTGDQLSQEQVNDYQFLNNLTSALYSTLGRFTNKLARTGVGKYTGLYSDSVDALYRNGAIVQGLQIYLWVDASINNAFNATVFNIGDVESYSSNATPAISDIFGYSFADTNGDGNLDLVKQLVQSSNQWITAKNQANSRAQLQSVADPRGKKTTFEYSDVSDSSVYSAMDASTSGELVIRGGYPLLKSMTVEDSTSASSIKEQKAFKYENIRVNLFGRGMLGAEFYTVNNLVLDNSVTTEYHQDFPLIGREKSAKSQVAVSLGSPITINESSLEWDATTSAPYRVTLDKQTSIDYEQSPHYSYGKTITDYTFDTYGNLTNKTVTLFDMLNSEAEVSEYAYSANYPFESGYNSVANWIISFAKSETESWSRASNQQNTNIRSGGNRSLTKTYTQYQDTLRPLTEVLSTPTGDLTKIYDYDGFGNVTSLSSYSATDTVSTVNYSEFQGNKWPTKVSNNLYGDNVKAVNTYDGRYGGTTSITDYAGITTSTEFDQFGRTASQTDALNNTAVINYTWCASGMSECVVNASGTLAAYYVTTSTPGAPDVIEYYDAFSNKLKEKKDGFSSGEYIYQQWNYDNAGRLANESVPSFSFPITTLSTTTYDDLGRVQSVTKADGGSLVYTYAIDGSNRKTTQNVTIAAGTSGASNRTSTREDYFSADGLVVKSIQALGDATDEVTTLYDYDPQQNLDWTQVQASNVSNNVVITQKFDVLGNRIYMNDPDTGIIVDTYSPKGNLLSTINNSNQMVSYTYDSLDRTKTRTEPEGVTTWYYDTAPECTLDDQDSSLYTLNGYVCAVASPSQNYKEQYAYSLQGQRLVVREELTGYEFGTAGRNWLVAYSYDNYGRDSGTIYDSEVEIVRNYTDTGYLDLVYNYSAPTTQYYDVTSINTYGGVHEFTLGNGVDVTHTVDPTSGRLTAIAAVNASGVELVNEHYDWFSDGALYSKEHTRPNSTVNETYSYDALSRLDTVTRNGVTEQYDYNVLGNIINKPGINGAYAYEGVRNAGPHAVTQAGGVNYGYDERGNMTQRGSYSIAYTSYDKPHAINSSVGNETFSYGPDRSRFRHVSGNTTTYYQTGSPYEEIFTSGNSDSVKRHYIDGGLVLDLEGGVQTYKYQIKDYKDSLLVVTDEAGNALQYATFDAYGTRTEGDNSLVTRGFTDHEHLDSGLIHMNGRVYDPVIGRFLSADMYIQAPYNSQSYNRYSYVWNNPVSFIDPSGYTVEAGYFNSGAIPKFSFTSNYSILEGLLDFPIAGLNIVASSLNVPLNILGEIGSFTNEYEGEIITIGTSFHPATGFASMVGTQAVGSLRFLKYSPVGNALAKEASRFKFAWQPMDDLPLIDDVANGGRNFIQDLLSMKRLKGNSDIAQGARADAETLGNAWVNGKNVQRFELDHGGYGLTDGTRTFRLQYKPKDGIWKANFQENTFVEGRAKGIEIKNVHMNIIDMVAP